VIGLPTRTKIEINPAIVRRISGLDDLARIIFPDNRNQRRVFIAIWVEIKYAQDQFLPSMSHLPSKYEFSQRLLETVRARMKKMGLLKNVSHFNPRYRHRSGWVFSERFSVSLGALATSVRFAKRPSGRKSEEQKDLDSIHYV
jgi:hypothetical protein